MRILFVLRTLAYGGTERQTAHLARALLHRGHEIAAAVFYSGGDLEADLAAATIPVHRLDKRSRWDVAPFLLRLVRLLRTLRPEVVHSLLPVPNVVMTLLRPLLPRFRLVWAKHASVLDLSRYDRMTRLTYDLERRLAPLADLIIVNSHAGLDHALRLGYPAGSMAVVPSAIDTERFRPDLAARARVRDEWEIAPDAQVVVLVARLDPLKDHETFLAAAARVHARRPEVQFVCAGAGSDEDEARLAAHARALGLEGSILWRRNLIDVREAYHAGDVACSSSITEGLPVAVGEAMACGLPAVVTDVGDSARLVGETGWVVPPRDPGALADGLVVALASLPAARGARARARVVERYGIDRMAAETERLLADGARQPAAKRTR